MSGLHFRQWDISDTEREMTFLTKNKCYKIVSFGQMIPIEALIQMSRGNICADDVKVMEMNMLIALKWRLNPPTAVAFARELLSLMPVMARQRQNILELSHHLLEHSVMDSFFIAVPTSSIAAATILVAASYSLGGEIPPFVLGEFEENLARYASIDIRSYDICILHDRLDQVYQEQHAL